MQVGRFYLRTSKPMQGSAQELVYGPKPDGPTRFPTSIYIFSPALAMGPPCLLPFTAALLTPTPSLILARRVPLCAHTTPPRERANGLIDTAYPRTAQHIIQPNAVRVRPVSRMDSLGRALLDATLRPTLVRCAGAIQGLVVPPTTVPQQQRVCMHQRACATCLDCGMGSSGSGSGSDSARHCTAPHAHARPLARQESSGVARGTHKLYYFLQARVGNHTISRQAALSGRFTPSIKLHRVRTVESRPSVQCSRQEVFLLDSESPSSSQHWVCGGGSRRMI